MDETLEEMKRGGAIVVLSCAMAALVWLAPVSAYPNTTKGELVAAALDAVILPLVEMVGKVPLIVALGVIAALGAGHALGLKLPRPSAPDFPPLPERPAPDADLDLPVAPPARRRGLAAMTELRDAEAQPDARKPSTEAIEAQARAVLGDDFTLTDEIADRAMDLAAEWERRGTPHGQHIDPIAIIRKRREKDRDWSADRSWLGGLPRLAGQAWPRGKDGVPLPFVAQLDLAEIAAANPDTPLPKAGSLAFFINEGAVLYVPPGDHPPTPAPEGLPPAFEETGYPLPEAPSPVTHPLFPFWPVEPVRMRMPDDLPPVRDNADRYYDAVEAAQRAAMAAIAPRSPYSFSASGRQVEGIDGAGTVWWYCADLVLRQLQAALAYVPRANAGREKAIADGQAYQARLLAASKRDEKALADSRAWEERNRAAIPEIEAQGRALFEFVEHFAAFAAHRDPWAVMREEEVAVLAEVMETARRDYGHLCRYNVSYNLEDLRSAAIRRMITGDQRAAAAIPDALLALINEQYRLPTDWQHQMFGIGGRRQDALYDHLCDHLLLQIVYDALPEFRFGDMGLWQFWISREALAAGRWDKVELTFECS